MYKSLIMHIFYTVNEFERYRQSLKSDQMPIGFVPTMGALHEGHLSLVGKAKECNTCLVSIFVNPTQFNDVNDLKNYPRDIERDIRLLKSSDVDAVLVPETKDIYPENDNRQFNFGTIENIMEGTHRPGHFNGVAQVVSRLFDIFKPDKAYFGQKDFQQLAIIKKLVQQYQYPVEIIPCPIIREKDGLAMSSRNQLLSREERKHAGMINKILFEAREIYKNMSVEELRKYAIGKLNAIPQVQTEYFEIVDTLSLEPVESWKHPGEIIACLAVKINKIRLIDNLIFD